MMYPSFVSINILLLLVCSSLVSYSESFSLPKNTLHTTTTRTSTVLHANFFDNLSNLLPKTPPSALTKKTPKVEVPKDFVIPEPKPLTITESTDLFRFAKNTVALALRLATGTFVLGWKIDSIFYDDNSKYSLKVGPFRIRDSSSVLQDAPRPKQPLILYEYDASPFCKRVRETINLLDLTVEYRPCPGARQGQFSNDLEELTGRRQIPYLIDPNTNTALFESNDQIEYLLQTYGPPESEYDRKALWPITFESFSIFTSTQVAILLGFPGSKRQTNARPDNEQMIPLELWGYETSPFVRPVREKLGSLCLPHIMVSCSRGSANRDKMVELTGRFQVPYLVDKNTGISLYESTEIEKYLEAVYTVKD